MSMSTHVVGFRPADEKWKKMKAVWDASVAAGITPPVVCTQFFNGEAPDPAGVEVRIDNTECCHGYSAGMCNGVEIDVTKLPKDVTIIRFYNSY